MKQFTRLLFAFVLTGVMSAWSGCAAPSVENPPPLRVPWSGSVTRLATLESSDGNGMGSALLEDGDVPIGRGERAAVVATESSSVSSFTTYTYDVQPLGVPGVSGSWGYRQRWVVQSGVSTP